MRLRTCSTWSFVAPSFIEITIVAPKNRKPTLSSGFGLSICCAETCATLRAAKARKSKRPKVGVGELHEASIIALRTGRLSSARDLSKVGNFGKSWESGGANRRTSPHFQRSIRVKRLGRVATGRFPEWGFVANRIGAAAIRQFLNAGRPTGSILG